MDFLNKAYRQLAELFKGMTPGSRITAGMLLLLIVVSLTYLFVFQSNTANRFLYDGREFSEAELSDMESAFAAANLVDYEISAGRVRVPGSQQALYLQALQKADFQPVNFESAMSEALNNSRSFLESSELTRQRLEHAQEQRLARAVTSMAGIERATARFTHFKKGGFPAEDQRKATIVVAGKGNRPLSMKTVGVIRDTAAGWWGIKPEDVMVTDLNSEQSYRPETDGVSKESKIYAEVKAMYEQQYQNNIYEILSVYPGIVVGVNVELDPDIINESTKVSVDPQAIALDSQTFSKTTESSPVNGGRPGAVPNEVAGNVPREVASTTGQKSSSDENREQQRSIAGHEQTKRKKAGLVPQSVTATISLPKSYFRQLCELDKELATTAGGSPGQVTDTEIAAKEKEITEQIKNKVVHMLPTMDVGDSPFPQVEVSGYDDLPPLPPEEPSFASTALTWFSDNWQTLGLFGVGVFSLLLLRSTIRSATPREATAPAQAAQQATETEEEESEEAPAILQRRARPTGASLREELTAMVREDPDAAANVLRTWIGDAA